MEPDRKNEILYLEPGTKVSYDGIEGVLEYGIVVQCWFEDTIGEYDCYIAFYKNDNEGKPVEKPYILRYAVNSLSVLSKGSL